MTAVEKQNLIDYLDQLVAEGKEVKMGWEGGGDSGWCWFEIDGKQIEDNDENSHIRTLLDYLYDTLDYGSWAGEFNAQGEAIYDSDQRAFIGTDYYCEDETISHECDIQIRVPKFLWFDRMEVAIEDEEARVDAVFHVRNGFLTEAHENFLTDLIEYLDLKIDETITDYNKQSNSKEYRNMWEHLDLSNADDFTDEGEYRVYDFGVLNIGVCDETEKEIYLDLSILSTNDEDDE